MNEKRIYKELRLESISIRGIEEYSNKTSRIILKIEASGNLYLLSNNLENSLIKNEGKKFFIEYWDFELIKGTWLLANITNNTDENFILNKVISESLSIY